MIWDWQLNEKNISTIYYVNLFILISFSFMNELKYRWIIFIKSSEFSKEYSFENFKNDIRIQININSYYQNQLTTIKSHLKYVSKRKTFQLTIQSYTTFTFHANDIYTSINYQQLPTKWIIFKNTPLLPIKFYQIANPTLCNSYKITHSP